MSLGYHGLVNAPDTPHADARFLTTRWSLVLAAGRGSSRPALESLCRSYWYPLYAFVRRRGEPHERAADLVQGFFALLLERGDLVDVAPEKGRFRSFLLASLSHHVSNERDRERALKRGAGRTPIQLDAQDAETRYRLEPAHGDSPEKIFARHWALEMLTRTFERLEAEMTTPEEQATFEALKPELQGAAEERYAPIAERLGTTEGSVRTAAYRLRKRWRALLRAEVAATVADPADVDDEIRGLFEALSR